MITYKTQFDKLTRAYIENRVRPMSSCACFIGNLLNGDKNWIYGRRRLYGLSSHSATECINKNGVEQMIEVIQREAEGMYTPEEIIMLEGTFLSTINEVGGTLNGLGTIDDRIREGRQLSETQEDVLFKGFEAALDLLKEIHLSKGEVIEDELVFTKRTLQYENV